MKLLHITAWRFSAITSIVLAFWSVFFYLVIVNEVNDELDDSLEDYAEMVMRRHLAGEPLPSQSIGSNNQFYIHKVSYEYTKNNPQIHYADRNVFIKEKNEYEPARVITYIFQQSPNEYYEIEVSTPTIDKDDLTANILWWLIGLYLAINLSIFIINLWTMHHSMIPLKHILSWLDNYKLGNKNSILTNDTKIDEFKKLNKAITESMERNEQMYEQQQMFISNASHEIQTPLAVCLNRIEMMLDDANISEQEMGELLKMKRSLNQLSRMNRELLLICKIDNGQYSQTENVNLTEKVAEALKDQEIIFSNRNITVNFLKKEDMRVLINDSMANILITNLIKNAFVHNVPNGKINIIIEEDRLIISNTDGDKPLDKEKIFMRFYHTPTKGSSSGLGLSIVKAICIKNSLSISYTFNDNLHTFTLLNEVNQHR